MPASHHRHRAQSHQSAPPQRRDALDQWHACWIRQVSPCTLVTGTSRKGSVLLPVLRCVRGTTSLESFHLHLARFILGTSANAMNFQAFLLDSIARWNTVESQAALDAPKPKLHTFDVHLQHTVNDLSHSLGMPPPFEHFLPPQGQGRRPGQGSPAAERLGGHNRAGQGHLGPDRCP